MAMVHPEVRGVDEKCNDLLQKKRQLKVLKRQPQKKQILKNPQAAVVPLLVEVVHQKKAHQKNPVVNYF
jgi:hypothetical protein